MQIGIDTRMSGPNIGGGGLGRYVEQFINELPNVDQKNRYVLFGGNPQTKTMKYVPTDIAWYSWKEQILLPRLIDKQQLDLVHFPHWNVPLKMKTPFVVTIHDLILLEEPKSARATTRHPIVFALKYQGFKRVLSHAVEASKKIITISEATKHDLLKHFPNLSSEKITVIYEGVTPLTIPSPPLSSPTNSPYLLYVGNCYPHKNLHMLLQAFDVLHKTFPDLHLIFAGRDDIFSQRLEQQAKLSPHASFIKFVRNPDDAQLASLYAQAQVYVFPSRIEGFGLPPLEAMSAKVPVACSDIPSLKEVLGEAALYFSPHDPEQMAQTISILLRDQTKRAELIAKGTEQIKRYSWNKMAEQIVRVYNSCEHLQT